jgi:hypothetical protein
MPDGTYVRAAAWHDEPERRAQRDLLPGASSGSKMSAPAANLNGQAAEGADGGKGKHPAKAR